MKVGWIIAVGLLASGCLNSSNATPDDAGVDAATPDAGNGADGSVAPDAGNDATADAGSDAAPSECTPPTGAGTTHASGRADTETWTAAGSPHIVTSDMNIYGTLTLEPCAEVLLPAKATITVTTSGKLVAEGTATKRIHIGAKDPTKPFSVIRSPQGSPIRLAYTTIDGGGDPQNTIPYLAGTLDLQGTDGSKPAQGVLSISHATIAGSATNGIVLRDGAGFTTDSTALTITGSAQYPINVWGRSMGTVPDGTYTGNAHDEILVQGVAGNETIGEDITIHDRGVPYHVGHDTSFGDLRASAALAGGFATVTIEAGVVMRFKKGGDFKIELFQGTDPATAAIIAAGTAAKPIVFTSAEAAPAAGDWLGIWFGEVPDARNKIDFARVEYAGGQSTSGSGACPDSTFNNRTDAAIRIFGPPASEFVTNTTIASSGSYGIDRGYRSDTKIDFTATNTFTSIAFCKQTYPKDANGGCPATIPCD